MADSLPIGGEEPSGSDYSSPITSPGSTPLTSQSPQHINDLHNMSDVDVGDLSQHHTVGPRKGQSASGFTFAQHKHTGTDGSKTGVALANQDLTNLADKWLGIPIWYSQVIQHNPVDFSSVAFADWLTGIVFPASGNLPLWAQDGTALIDIYAMINNVKPITNAQTDNYRLVTNAVNGTAISDVVAVSNTLPFTIALQQIGVSITAASTTVTTKVQANCTAAGIRLNSNNAGSALYSARIYK
jgi:hypothetical protein